MRKLMWFTAGVVIACVVGVYLLSGSFLLIMAGVSLVACLSVFRLKSKAGRIIFTVFLGALVSFLWLFGFDSLYLAPARELDGETVDARIEASDFSYETNYGYATDGRVKISGRIYRIRFYSTGSYSPGDVVEGDFYLQFTSLGGRKENTYHQGKGIFLIGSGSEELQVVRTEKIPARYFAVQLRESIQRKLDSVFPEDTIGFARALLLGDSSKLSEEEDLAYSQSGIRHVIAVSGLHVSILFSLIYAISGGRKWMSAILGIPLLILFAAVAGFTPSIMRACIMQCLMIIAILVNQEYDPPTALAFSILTMLMLNPLTITSVSFQLSAGCMVGIMLFAERIHRYLLDRTPLGPAKGKSLKAKLTRWFVSSVSITLSATVVTTPLCAYYFGMVSLVGVFTNLLALWVVSFIFYGIMLACLLGAVYAPLGKAVAWCVSWLIRYVQLCARGFSKIPFSAVYTGDLYVVAWLIVAYILFVIFLFTKKKRPMLFISCVIGCLAVCLCLSAFEQKTEKCSVTVMDVGQGQSVLLRCGDETYLVDCGGDSAGVVADTVRQQMMSDGIRYLDGVILTHYDMDHCNGILPLLEKVRVDCLYLPNIYCETDIKERLYDQYSDRITTVGCDMQISMENGVISLFATETTKNENDSSLCILFQPGDCDILITGDRGFAGEQALLEDVEFPQIEVLVAGHHGSENSTSLELLYATCPTDVVISVGEGNPFGHPNEETIMRLEMFDCRIWRTDINGTIQFRG